MKEFLLSFLVGSGVGLAYTGLRVRSPAPPLVAIVGLVGMLAGEQAIPFLRTWHHASPHAAHGSPLVPDHTKSDIHTAQLPKETL